MKKLIPIFLIIFTLSISTALAVIGGGGLEDASVEILDDNYTTNGPELDADDIYGQSITNIGDLDNDGIDDLAVGAVSDHGAGTDQGAVHIHFMNADGSIDNTVEINGSTANGPTLNDSDHYGYSITALGDFDGDNVEDIAVGAHADNGGGAQQGAVHIHFLNTDGSVKSTVELNKSTVNGATAIVDNDYYGTSVANIGDLNGDGQQDLAVGAFKDDAGGTNRGTVYIHFMNTNDTGDIVSTVEINSSTAGAAGLTLSDEDHFGRSITNIGDLDGDTIQDLAVGAIYDDEGGADRGALHILFMDTDGSVKSTAEINSSTTNGPNLDSVWEDDEYGTSVTNLGDINEDGVQDLAVGCWGCDGWTGVVHIHYMNTDGSIDYTVEINDSTLYGPTLESEWDSFGASITNWGDQDGNGVPDLAVGAPYDDQGGNRNGAVHLLYLSPLTVSGTLYSDNGTTAVTSDSNAKVSVLVNGVLAGTDSDGTDGSGVWEVETAEFWEDDIITAFLDGSSNNAATVSQSLYSIDELDFDLYYDTLITRHENTGPLTNANLDTGHSGDSDLSAIYANGGGSTLDLAESLYIPSGETFAPDGNITIAGNWNNQGTFTSGSNTVTFDGTNQSVKGASSFYNFTADQTSSNDGIDQTISFQDSIIQTITGTLNLTGLDTDDKTNIRSTTPGVHAYLKTMGSTITADYIDVKDNRLFRNSSTEVDPENSTDSENTHLWFTQTPISNGGIGSTIEINDSTTNGPTLNDSDFYGSTIANIGDLNNDGVNDIAVGAAGDSKNGTYRGAVHIHFMNTDGSIDSTIEINDSTTNGATLDDFDYYGQSIANMGDLNGDGVIDLAVGAYGDDEGGTKRGAVHIHFMNTDGSIDSTIEINNSTTNGPTLINNDFYGKSVANIGDLNRDGVQDLAVGAYGDDEGGTDRGAIHIHFMNTDGSIDSTVEINSSTTNGPTLNDEDSYGNFVANIDDLNGDGVQDIAIRANNDDEGGTDRGAIHISFMNTDGSIDSTVEINSSTTNGPILNDEDYYGNDITNIGDLNGDGVNDLAIGAQMDDEGGSDRGTIHIHFMNIDGSIDSTVEINDSTTNGPTLNNSDWYGFSIANIGDLNEDGINDLAVGAVLDSDGGWGRGKIYIHFLTTVSDLELSMSVDTATPHTGDQIQYNLILKNTGSETAENVQVTNTLPASVSYSSSSTSQGSYSNGVWTVGDITGGEQVALTITVSVTETVGETSFTNTAEVTASTTQDSDSTPNNGVTTEDDYAQASSILASAETTQGTVSFLSGNSSSRSSETEETPDEPEEEVVEEEPTEEPAEEPETTEGEPNLAEATDNVIDAFVEIEQPYQPIQQPATPTQPVYQPPVPSPASEPIETGETISAKTSSAIEAYESQLPKQKEPFQPLTEVLAETPEDIDSDEDGISDAYEISQTGSLEGTTVQYYCNISSAEIENLSDSPSIALLGEGVITGDKIAIRICANQNEEVDVEIIEKENLEKVYKGMVTTDDEGKGILILEKSLENSEYYVVVKGKTVRSFIVDKDLVPDAPTLELVEQDLGYMVKLVLSMNEEALGGYGKIYVKGTAEPRTIVFATWQSRILSSIVISDASQGKFNLEIPQVLALGNHDLHVFSYNEENNAISNVSTISFSK